MAKSSVLLLETLCKAVYWYPEVKIEAFGCGRWWTVPAREQWKMHTMAVS